MLANAVMDEILQHLGGKRVLESVGAHNFVADDNEVSFTLGRNPGRVHTVTIARQTRSSYRMNCYGFIAPGTFKAPLVASAGGVHGDNLATTLGQFTGLDKLHHRHF